MNTAKGTVVSVHLSQGPALADHVRAERIRVTLEGIRGDSHFGFTRWSKSKGDVERNWRQWTALSVEEAEIIRQNMNLRELAAELLGPNIVVEGIPDFSRLPRGTKLVFRDNATLVVEDFTDPCLRMGQHIADTYGTDADGQPIKANAFPKAANKYRGLVGVVDREGVIVPGDEFDVVPFESKFGK